MWWLVACAEDSEPADGPDPEPSTTTTTTAGCTDTYATAVDGTAFVTDWAVDPQYGGMASCLVDEPSLSSWCADAPWSAEFGGDCPTWTAFVSALEAGVVLGQYAGIRGADDFPCVADGATWHGIVLHEYCYDCGPVQLLFRTDGAQHAGIEAEGGYGGICCDGTLAGERWSGSLPPDGLTCGEPVAIEVPPYYTTCDT